jgi:hypothetical protein
LGPKGFSFSAELEIVARGTLAQALFEALVQVWGLPD